MPRPVFTLGIEEEFQTYEVKLTFRYEAQVFEDDPDDRFLTANLEKDDLQNKIETWFPGCVIDNLTVKPIIAPGE